MIYREYLPNPRLRELVRVYVYIGHFHTVAEQEHRFMPERSVGLTFAAGQSWFQEEGGGLRPIPLARLEGLSLTSQRVLSPGMMRVMAADLYPWGARQLFGWQSGTNFDVAALYPAQVRAITALVDLGRIDEAQQTLEDWLLRLLSERGAELGKGKAAAARLYQTLGNAKIGLLADELNLSQRQLERQFAQEVGVNAKTLARVIRFEEVYNRLWLDPATPLALLAYDLGFADQAHLTREFRTLSTLTPRQFTQWSLQQPREAWQEIARKLKEAATD